MGGEDFTGRDVPGQPPERELWHPDCIVSFQENAWCDAKTNLYGLKRQVKLEAALQKANINNPIHFEDNLGSHLTDEVLAYWKTDKPHWGHRTYPKKLTWCMQVVDRHLGILYKTDVYRGFRAEMMKRVNACRDNEIPAKFTSREKRIMITHIVAATHKRVQEADGVFRAFIATGTWLPIDGTQDADVKLQGVPDYNYSNQVTPAAMQLFLTQHAEERKKVDLENASREAALARVRAAAEQQQVVYYSELSAKVPADLITTLLDGTAHRFIETIRPTLTVIASHLKRDFIVYGSYPAAVLVEELQKLNMEHQHKLFPLCVKKIEFSDIDVMCGVFGIGSGELVRKKHSKTLLSLLPKELNIIEGENIPAGKSFLATIDVNMVAICCEVKIQDDKITAVQLHVHPAFWDFAVGGAEIQAIRFLTPAQTSVRIAYKAFKNALPFTMERLDCTVGEFFKSHNAKVCTDIVHLNIIYFIFLKKCWIVG